MNIYAVKNNDGYYMRVQDQLFMEYELNEHCLSIYYDSMYAAAMKHDATLIVYTITPVITIRRGKPAPYVSEEE